MALTVGSTLQNGKYVIQAIESESDRGITYRANHTDLDQIVMIQTVKRQDDRPADVEFQKQFLQAAKTLAQRQPPIVRVRDYFTESDQPFVVLEPIAEHTIPSLEDWFSGTSSETRNGANQKPSITEAIAALPAPAKQITEPRDQLSIAKAISVSRNLNGSESEKISHNGTKVAEQQQSQPKHVPSVLRSIPRKSWLPIGLLTTALMAGFFGASYGWALRFSAPQGSSGGGLSLFDKEQSFPPVEGFPGEDPSDYEAPEVPTHSIREVPPRESSRYQEPYVEPYRSPERPITSRVSTPQDDLPADANPAQDVPDSPVIVPTEPATPPVEAAPPAEQNQPVDPQPKVETVPPVPVAPPAAPDPIGNPPAPISQ